MLRCAIAAMTICATALPAYAEVWMVKSSSVLGCQDRETLIEFDKTRAAQSRESAPPGCVVLESGERLLDQQEVGIGFNDYMKVQRRDGSTLFVRGSNVVPDPGIGSLTDDRAE